MASSTSHLQPMVAKLARQSVLGSDEIDALFALPCRLSRLERASYIVREGDKTTSCCVLLTGFAYRHKMTGSGKRQILSIHLRGDLVDLQNSLLGTADHNVQVLSDAEVALIPLQAIMQIASTYPNIARAMWTDAVIEGSVSREWLLNIGQRDARQRICHLLCELALRQEAAGICKGPRYEWPMTQEQIGDATGLTPVHVNRTIQSLRADGLLTTSGRQITITDWHMLQEAGDFSPAYLQLCTGAGSAGAIDRNVSLVG